MPPSPLRVATIDIQTANEEVIRHPLAEDWDVAADYRAVVADYEAQVRIDWLSSFFVGYVGADYGAVVVDNVRTRVWVRTPVKGRKGDRRGIASKPSYLGSDSIHGSIVTAI